MSQSYRRGRVPTGDAYDVFEVAVPPFPPYGEGDFPPDFDKGDPVFVLSHVGKFPVQRGHCFVMDPHGICYYMPRDDFDRLFAPRDAAPGAADADPPAAVNSCPACVTCDRFGNGCKLYNLRQGQECFAYKPGCAPRKTDADVPGEKHGPAVPDKAGAADELDYADVDALFGGSAPEEDAQLKGAVGMLVDETLAAAQRKNADLLGKTYANEIPDEPRFSGLGPVLSELRAIVAILKDMLGRM